MISIIVPIYNSSKYLKACIDSILNQSYKNFELLLVDDGSTDHSLAICESYNDKRIRIIKLLHKGVSNARNVGIKKSLGTYICFVDSDDIIEKNYLTKMYNHMDKDVSFVECNFDSFSDTINSAKITDIYNVIGKEEMFYRMYSVDGIRTNIIVNKLYRKDVFEKIYFENVCHEDEFIIHKIINNSNKIVILEDVLYHYRIHSDSRQRIVSTERIEVLNVYKERKNIFDDEKFQDLNYKAMLDEIIYLYCVFYKYKKFVDLKMLYNYFTENYNSKYNFNIKRKIKYILFIKLPNVTAELMLYNRRYKNV